MLGSSVQAAGELLELGNLLVSQALRVLGSSVQAAGELLELGNLLVSQALQVLDSLS